MESLINYQIDTFDRIKRSYANYKKSPKERITKAYVESRLETLEKSWEDFLTGHKEMIQVYDPTDLQKSNYIKEEIYYKTEEEYINYKCILKTVLSEFMTDVKGTTSGQADAVNVSHSAQSEMSEASHSLVKLPQINIPNFSGKYTEWTTFRDLFVSMIHSNKALHNVQKLHYLKSYLKGEAEQLLRNIPIAEDNYERCWALLQERYNNKKYISNCILKRMLGQKTATGESPGFLRELIDTSTDCLNALSNLGIDVSSWDILIIYILSLKLDVESRKQWELHVASNIATHELPTFKQFQNFIFNRFRALEFVDQRTNNKPNQSHQTTVVSKFRSLHVAGSDQSHQCPFCSETHRLYLCKEFVKQDSDARRDFVQNNGICFNCLGSNHSAKMCRSPVKCRICRRHHHTLVHPKIGNPTTTRSAVVTAEDIEEEIMEDTATTEEETDIMVNTVAVNSPSVLLATAVVNVEKENGEIYTLRALLDQGSQASFVTEATVQLLRLRKVPVKGRISGVGGEKVLNSSAVVHLRLKSVVEPEVEIEVKAHVLKSITSFLPSRKIVELEWLQIPQTRLADPLYHTPNKIDILLGAEIYSQIIREGVEKDPTGSVVAQSTAFGWILSGQVGTQPSANIHVMQATIEDDAVLKKFWELEAEPAYSEEKMFTEEESRCEEFFSRTTTRDSEGRYVVKLPFKENKPKSVEGSKEIARGRFLALERKLEKNEILKEEYTRIFKEYLTSNLMKEVTKEEKEKPAVYLPYHEVIREDKETTKVRIVMNASSKGRNGVSLNDSLMIGPALQMKLRHVIMRWRAYPVALVADIVKMYHQIKVDEEDANFQRILWRDSPEKDITEYKLLRVTFGTACAPYLAVRCLMQVALDEGHNFPMAAERVLKDFYMDDLLTGCETVEEGIQIQEEMTKLLEKAGFKLQKWSSNSEQWVKEVNQEKEDKEKDTKQELKIKDDAVIKILGLTWNRRDDVYQYTVALPMMKEPVTKRNIIADISRLFDPLGWVAPTIIIAKIIIQKLWLSGIGWDDEVPAAILNEWNTYREELTLLKTLNIPRSLGFNIKDIQIELHGFSDASQTAYAAAVYIRTVDSENNIKVNLVTAKTKVAPIKQVSIPRMELCGAVLLAKLMAEVGAVLEIPKGQWFAWTDSTVVLAWINSHPSRWKTFIANRVSTILDTLEPQQWSHVRSKQNPADLASRGLRPAELIKANLWFTGPEILKEINIKREKPKDLHTKLEEAKVHFTSTEEEIWERFSTLTRLVRVVAYCRRFLNMKKPKKERHTNKMLTKEEIQEALETCLRQNQLENFKEEIDALQKGESLKRNSKILTLNPYLDEKKILRVGGRLNNSNFDTDRKHQILMPKKGNITKLLIGEAHQNTLHGGPQAMLRYLYSKYWIIGCKLLVKGHVRKCTTCVRYSGVVNNPMMGQLPAVRVTPSRPFKSSGVDYAGPINIRTAKGRGQRSYKGYICLFICMVTRAVHIEVVSDLTSQGFLAAFRRFVARRGHCTDLYSDNGTNFLGASRELTCLSGEERSQLGAEIMESLATKGTQWHFIPPRAPNFGGLWEAAIKSTKFHLKRVIGDATLTYEELATVLVQVEACLNSRPLSRIESDSEHETILTPGHFLVGEALVTAPDRNFESSNISSLRRWQLTQRILQDFWRKWSRDYINRLQTMYKWQRQTPEIKEGDIVLVKEDDLPPSRWLMGKVVMKHPGADKVTRVVTLRTKTSLMKRPVSKLCILPIAK